MPACAVTVVIFGHLIIIYLLTYLLTLLFVSAAGAAMDQLGADDVTV